MECGDQIVFRNFGRPMGLAVTTYRNRCSKLHPRNKKHIKHSVSYGTEVEGKRSILPKGKGRDNEKVFIVPE
jgi:hypothetical protein